MKLIKSLLIASVTLTLAAGNAPAQPPDALDETLAMVGLKREDLGWNAKGWWVRWPEVTYKLRAFDSLFAEPLDTVAYTRALARTAWERLDPAELAKLDAGRNSRSLFQAVQALGIDPKYGGFRGYTSNTLAPEMPLDKAILELYKAARRTTQPNTFGMELPYPKIEEHLAEQVKSLPEGVSPILGQLVLSMIEARYWTDLAFRKVDAAERMTVATRYDVGEEMIDAYDYCPAMDDVARAWDEASMWYAAQKCVDALDLARIKLEAWRAERAGADPASEPAPFAFAWETAWGWIIVRGGSSDDADATIRPPGTSPAELRRLMLVVDLWGNDRHVGPYACASPEVPISLMLDLAGDDRYETSMGQGAGLTGVGVLIDAAGDDDYAARRYAQGVGQFGFGLLADLSGDDHYRVDYSGQGCGYFGVGLLFDAAGHDEYRIYADGQGLGGVAGVGVLADRTGNDRYIAERKHSVTGRPSYHSPGIDVAVSNVQGVGMGRRGDGSDGHSWAGGLGALLDGEGDDAYVAGNWCMGTGYWFGIGLLHDGGGDDEYRGCVYTQGTGAHFCIGVCIDEAGNDKHLAEENSHSALAWGHDFSIAILLNNGGDDLYSVDTSGLAYSINRSVAMVIDTGGNDVYKTDLARRQELKQGLRPGTAINDERFRARDGVSSYFADTTSIGLFLDIGGDDTYWGDLANDAHWLDPPDAPNWMDRNFSVGVDRATGVVNFTPRPVRVPTGARPSPPPPTSPR